MSKVHEIITDQIIKQLEQGTIPWKKPWGGPEDAPKNLVSKKEYSGINFFLLSMLGHESPYYLTFKQAKLLGGSVKKGSKGFPIVFWKKFDKPKTNTKGEIESMAGFMMRYYTVFNASQCEDLDESKIPELTKTERLEFDPIEEAEKIANGYIGAPPVIHERNKACYIPIRDTINMPRKERFHTVEGYYSTLFHEMTHSTGSAKRLDRPGIVDFDYQGSHQYSKEELIAELGAAFLCSMAGIDNTLDNSAAYIQSWLRTLKSKDNSKWIVEAGSKAQKAVNYIKGDLAKA